MSDAANGMFGAGPYARQTTADTTPAALLPARVAAEARWLGPRFQPGPACTPVTVHLPGGAAQAA